MVSAFILRKSAAFGVDSKGLSPGTLLKGLAFRRFSMARIPKDLVWVAEDELLRNGRGRRNGGGRGTASSLVEGRGILTNAHSVC